MTPTELKNVTLISVDGTDDPERAVRALKYSSREISFNSIKILACKKPNNLSNNIEYCPISRIDLKGYNKLVISQLYKYLNTDFCIIIQPDGFILNACNWMDEFLRYDYIGAPWPAEMFDGIIVTNYKKPPENIVRIGNGGFSLRSKRILEEASNLEFIDCPEDNFFCYIMREQLEKRGLLYAPVELGSKFSVEHPIGYLKHKDKLFDYIYFSYTDIDYSKYFGFHGKFHPSLINKLNEIE